MWENICCESTWQGEIWNRRKSGELLLCRTTITAIRDSRGVVKHYVSVFTDITESKLREEFIRHQAYHDALTDLPNRSLFMDRLKHGLSQARRNKQYLALMFIDMDNFKEVNDDCGHDVGDLLLKEVARRISSSVREADTVARLGGDEFTVILGDLIAPAAAVAVAEKILMKLSTPLRAKRNELLVSCSIGIAFYPDDGEDVDTLMEKADAAMYRVKQSGKSGYACFSKATHSR